MAGYHEQAVYDANCQRVALSLPTPLAGSNLNHRDNEAVYDMNLVFQLLQTCLRSNDIAFWAKVSHEHQFKVTLTDVDALRAAFIRHIFSGDCVSRRGDGCRMVVNNEEWPHSMGVRLIDDTIRWVEQGLLGTDEFVRTCECLNITTQVVNKKRSLMTKLIDRRRQLLSMSDAAALSLPDLLPQLVSSSSMKMIKSVGAAHDVEITENDTKIDGTTKILDHMTHGNCVEQFHSTPGCQRLTKDSISQHENAVHLQISVLQYILVNGSKKQLTQVLDIHMVDHDATEKKKKLRSRLKKYVQNVERGKLKEVDAETDTVERLRKLDEVRQNWPKLIPMAVKEKIIKDFRMATSSIALSNFTCACCARNLPIEERIRKAGADINLSLLDGPETNWNDSTFLPPPTPFTSGPLKDKLIDAHGVILSDDGSITLELCNTCSRGLHKGKLPKHALANKMYVGPVPQELSDLTMIEESMIARARAKSWIVKLQEQDSVSSSPTAQRGLKGHTIIYPQQPDELASILPRPVTETLTFICVIFVGSSTPTKEWLREKAKPLVVRREKVRHALEWLKENNPLYKDVKVDEQNLDALPDNDVLPYYIEHVADSEAQEALVSQYNNMDNQPNPAATDTRFESVVVTDVDAHTPASQLRAAAVHHAKTKGRSFVQIGRGARPVNEFFNVDLFPMMYPTLFPYGCGGFEDRKRGVPISLKEHVKSLFSWQDKRFQTHYSFLFTVFNILQRRALLLGSSLKVKKASFSQFAERFSSVSSEAVGKVLERIEKGEGVTARTDDEQKVLRLMKEVNLVTAKVPGSSSARVAMRNEIRALTMTHGMPSFYITINPADTHNPIVKFLAGADIDIDKMLQDQVPNYWEQSILLSSNPAIGATFFNRYLKAFVRTVLGSNGGDLNENGGVLGVVKAHYGCVEAQGRGSLHCHMLIWIEGALNPNEIRDKVMRDDSWGKRLLDYLDDTITNVVPEDPIPEVSTLWDEKDPCTLRGVDLDIKNDQERLALRMKDVNRLAGRVQRHRHSHTCYKYYKPGSARNCRFDLKEENFRSTSSIEPETGQIALRCLDGLVNNFNMTILEAVRCNMDIQFIGSGESAKAMIYYVTDYITKSQLKAHVSYAALQLAVKKCENVDNADDDFTVRSKRLLQKSAYALISHQELSAQQVASYLMGYEDHFTSHQFNCLYWASFERFIDRQDTDKFCNNMVDGNIDTEIEEDGADLDRSAEESEQCGRGREASEADDDVLADDDEEEVSFHVDERGNVAVLADQVSDYTMRPRELEDLSLWEFVAKAEKVYVRRSAAVENDDEISDSDVEEVPPNEQESENETRNENMSKPSGRAKEKYRFMSGHKEYNRKQVRLHNRHVVPVPIGPSMPRRDQTDAYPRYCRLMLILFKPWRTLLDLRDGSQSWESMFQPFVLTLNNECRGIIDNMQVLHECRDSRNDHMQTRVRDKDRGNRRHAQTEDGANDNIEDIDMSEVLDHLEDIDRMSSRRREEACVEADECLNELTKAGFFDTAEGAASTYDRIQPEPTTEHDDTLEDEWRDTYDKRKAAWKLETKQCEEDAPASMTMMNQITDMEIDGEEQPLINDAMVDEDGPVESDNESMIKQTAEKWTLNREQKRAFEIVARHTAMEKPEQLLMYLGGPGGTGKSRVVNALRDFFESRGETRRFRLAAYTGVAARNIGGATLHALLQMNESGRSVSAKTKRDLSAMWDGVDYLLVDELSMIGCEMLHNISRALTEAKGVTKAFGGINMILAGDFAQLPPIGDTRLYKDLNTNSLTAASTNRAQGKILGRLLWLSFETVIILHETMRQSGSENAVFVDLLQRLRDGCCTEDDYDMLVSRSIQSLPNVGEEWKLAPVIVTSNATRDVINRRAAEAFAEQVGAELHWYHAIDTHRKSMITDPGLIQKLEEQHSGQTKHRLRRIPLVIGMPVAVNQNFDVAAGVVNGSYGFLRKVRFFTDADGRRYLKSCVVEIPDTDAVEVPHLPKHHFPILPDTTDLVFEHGASHRKCKVKRKQVPIEPGFAMTVHKAQGKTMGRVIVDLAGCVGTEPPYVMVSRATSLNGLMVLRKFDKRQITKRRSEELRVEFARLVSLKWKTVTEYGEQPEIEEAKGKLSELHRMTKRKDVGVGRDSAVSKRGRWSGS